MSERVFEPSPLPIAPTKTCRRHSWMVAGYLLSEDKPTHERLRCRWCAAAKVAKLKRAPR